MENILTQLSTSKTTDAVSIAPHTNELLSIGVCPEG